jgi:AcrR family transcriptional regulator
MDKIHERFEMLAKIVDFDCSKGHLRWKVSDLARATRVSRPLIYYHFGKTKRDILMSSAEMLAEIYFGLTSERVQMLYDGRAWESVLISRDYFRQNPSFAVFYFRWRMTKSPLQMRLVELEKKYQAMLKKAFPKLSHEKILVLHAINQAVVTSPYLSVEALEQMHKLLLGLW